MNREKSVDESWKESAAQEKERLENIARGSGADKTSPRVNAQSSPQSSAGSRQPSQPQDVPGPTHEDPSGAYEAKFAIETLILLQEKTKGNLTQKESDVLNTAAYELQMKFVEISSSRREPAGPGEPNGQKET